jgi:bacillithiol biosynthesis deacetylase BshB1
MGAVGRDNLGLADGFFREDRDSLLKLITSIRKYRPEIVLANAVKDRHPDHGRGASFAARACFLSGLGKIITEWESHEQEKWRPKAIYHYIQDHQNKPDLIVDITAHIDKKMDCIKCFGSQFYDPASVEPSSPISGESFLKVIKAKSRVFGRYIDADFGEGFSITRPIGIENLLELI